MTFDEALGTVVSLPIRRFTPHGAALALDPTDLAPSAAVVLLPRSEVPPGAAEGQVVEVFIFADDTGRPRATTHLPKLARGEVTFLEITSVGRHGAFVDWGITPLLFVPKDEQTVAVRVGDRHPMGLVRSGDGLVGTMRVSEMLKDLGEFQLDEWVDGEAWRKDPDRGVFVIVERTFTGLVPVHEPTSLTRGERARFRVANVLPDGKIELSLRKRVSEEIDDDAAHVLAVLRESHARVSDKTSPEELRARFGLSKKAFKRAAGRLLRDRAVRLDDDGCFVVS